ncbi:MAG: hydrogenase iron-sulfur subunit [Syntrophobacteraceae bacterium]
MSDAFEPRILAFLCNWCSYAGADLAGVSRFQYPTSIRVLRTMCSGRVDPLHILEGVRSGFDAVFVFGCHIGDCHYLEGNFHTARRLEVVRDLFALSGIGAERAQLRWVSAAEGQLFASSVRELTEVVRDLGPLDREASSLPLSALAATLASQRLRWLLGMEHQLTEVHNVYNEKLDKGRYLELLGEAALGEYRKALVLESLRQGPQSVRDIAATSGLPIHTISMLLGEVQKAGKAELHSYEGCAPKFIRLDL